MFFVATAAIPKYLSLKIMCTHVRQNFWKVSSNSEHHSKSMMNINSQHHNLLGNQISPKSEDFCIWQPFYTLVTMAMAAILNFFQPPQKLPHTTVDIPTKWIIIWLPNHGYQFPTLKSTWKPNFAQIGGFLYFGHHSKPMMDINSQHRNLLGSQISPKSEDFCILVAILDSIWPP